MRTRHCPLCQRRKQAALPYCEACDTLLPRLRNSCFRCAIELTEMEESAGVDFPICGHCLATQPPQYRSLSLFAYAFPVAELVSEFKFHGQHYHLPALSALFAEHCRQRYTEDSLPEALLPVPLHAHRQLQRGFNQSQVLAILVGKALAIPVDHRVLQRRQHTLPQSKLSLGERHHNLRKAFVLARKTRHQHVAILDDVMTTGATMTSLAKLLLDDGLTRVDLWSLARTPK